MAYWLFKSEPSSFSWEDLRKSPKRTTHWDGVRNYQARNFLRDRIRKGDGILFYHSVAKPTAIVGIARVVREGYPDHTARDVSSKYFDPKASSENPRWYMVDIQAVVALEPPLTLEEMKGDPDLEGMELLKKGSRLSIQPVDEKHWNRILALRSLKDPL